MSLKRTAILLAVSHSNHHQTTNSSAWNTLASGNSNSHSANASDFYTATNFNGNNSGKSYNNQGMRVMRPGVGGFHGNVNILLGGAMLTVVTTIVCLICYCCHRKIKMRSSTSSLYRQQRWMENDPSMEIYSVEQYFDTSGLYSESDNLPTMTTNNEPPPSYDCVMALDEVISRKRKNLYTFKVYHHHHPGHAIKDCMGNGNGNMTPSPTTPQVSLDETNCDIQSPLSAASLCNCNCAINQNYATNLCASCNNVIDNADGANNNITTCSLALITGSNLVPDNCPLSDTNTNRSLPPTRTREIDLLDDQLNNNDCNGNSHQFDSIASPSTSTSTHYMSCSVVLSGEQLQRQNDIEDDDDDDDEINGNRSCRLSDRVNLDTINGNGLIRLDMSQIIDQTGLPTYEAALKLKSSGYV